MIERLQLIMEHVRLPSGSTCLRVWGCRGEGKGCSRNQYRQRTAHCEDCVEATDDHETLGEFCHRLQHGDS